MVECLPNIYKALGSTLITKKGDGGKKGEKERGKEEGKDRWKGEREEKLILFSIEYENFTFNFYFQDLRYLHCNVMVF